MRNLVRAPDDVRPLELGSLKLPMPCMIFILPLANMSIRDSEEQAGSLGKEPIDFPVLIRPVRNNC